MSSADDCMGLWATVLVFEHVTQQFLHGSVSDGPVEEQQLDPLRVHETQGRKKKKQLSKPENAQEIKIKSISISNRKLTLTLIQLI